jgi:hypothetical protein
MHVIVGRASEQVEKSYQEGTEATEKKGAKYFARSLTEGVDFLSVPFSTCYSRSSNASVI